MALDQTIIEILDEQAAAFNQTHTKVAARVSSGYFDVERFCFYDVQLFRESAFLGEHILRISHESPGPSFPSEITFSDPDEPAKAIAGSPEILAEYVGKILAMESMK